ncbi:zinc finger, CCHC-type, retrotransposon gag domain protein [Tanacetum coccineum]
MPSAMFLIKKVMVDARHVPVGFFPSVIFAWTKGNEFFIRPYRVSDDRKFFRFAQFIWIPDVALSRNWYLRGILIAFFKIVDFIPFLCIQIGLKERNYQGTGVCVSCVDSNKKVKRGKLEIDQIDEIEQEEKKYKLLGTLNFTLYTKPLWRCTYPIASTRWLVAVKGVFRTSNCKEKNKVNFASNFLRDSAKMCWEGKELFYAEFTPVEEIDRIREEFQTLTQTSETVNEMWKKFNDLIRYCPEYHGNEKLKVERFQRMLRDDILEVISPFKCTTLDDLLSRARVREADLLRKKNKEAMETKRKLSLEIVMPKSLNTIKEERVEQLKSRHHVRSVIKLILEYVEQICRVASNVVP